MLVVPGFHLGASRRRFRPTLAATLAVAVALPVLLGLGVWQLERGREKARLLTQAAAVQQQPPLDLGRAGSVDLIDDHRPVTVRGVFLGERQGLLDNQRGRVTLGTASHGPRVRGVDGTDASFPPNLKRWLHRFIRMRMELLTLPEVKPRQSRSPPE